MTIERISEDDNATLRELSRQQHDAQVAFYAFVQILTARYGLAIGDQIADGGTIIRRTEPVPSRTVSSEPASSTD